MKILTMHQAKLHAGFARIDITPPVGIYHRMWGAAKHDRATGIHRPLTATALVLSPKETEHPPRFLLALDHCLFWPKEMRTFLDELSARCQISSDRILVCFSHTHGAGLMGQERAELPGGELIQPYLDALVVRCADAITEAMQNITPVTLNVGSGKCDLATHRDFWDEDSGQFVCGFNPEGHADDTVIVGRFMDESGMVLGTLVNYACHPTTLAWENTKISPDYVGAMREVIERETGAPCFFILGACGDVGPRDGFVGDTTVADRNGASLGYAALSTYNLLPQSPQTDWSYAGAVASGATLGTWAPQSFAPDRAAQSEIWKESVPSVALDYASKFPTDAELLEQRTGLLQLQEKALENNDDAAFAETRALIERVDRSRIRYGSLPAGSSYPYQPICWRTGDILWVMLDGEFYNELQCTLRNRFPDYTVIVGTVVNGSSVWYLPNRESYGKGLYQEQASVLAQGSFEKVIEAVTDAFQQLI